jgi:DNA-binding transcriptional regulator YiaG|tara:strand:+ start:264 stop:842 length:579 start_codon:yes stop_codon:yes gene_type:complete
MNYEESIKYLRRKSHSAYEIHKATGLTEAGIRKVLNNKVVNPQRKTKEALIDYVNQLEGLNDFSESDFNTLDIKRIRTNLHLTQTALGKLLGVGLRTVQLWESGERNMTKTTKKLLNELIPRESNIITDELTLNQINLDQHDLLEDIIRRGVITERLTEIIIDNHEKLLLNSNYKNWFELQVYKKVLEVMSK